MPSVIDKRMIDINDIYRATNHGLDIILYYYPQADGCVDNKKKFKCRPEEDDASACLKRYDDCYKVTDFGDSARAMSPIDICMKEERVKFAEAVIMLAGRYNVTDELRREVNKPIYEKRPATPDEEEGKRWFELAEEFTPGQLAVLGPKVKAEHCKRLNWHAARSVSYVKNREVITRTATETYPIFIRQCVIDEKDRKSPDATCFYKVYEPLNPDKKYRFSYLPEGAKPKSYTNGLAELRKAYTDLNNTLEREFRNDPANENKPYLYSKLPEVFICSGERDALCCAAMGRHPVWFNSETYEVTQQEINQLAKYAEVIYNIPDIDETGIRRGKELALRFLDIHTVWLPDWLRNYRDRRGGRRKDLRDFVEVRPEPREFDNLLALAMPAKFWTQTYVKSRDYYKYDINTSYLHYFLTLNGFYTLRDETSDEVRYIRKRGFVVQRIKAQDIRNFLRSWAEERFLPVDIRNLILNSPRTNDTTLALLNEIELNFESYTPDKQYLYFRDCVWQVCREGVKDVTTQRVSDNCVWQENIIDHRVKLLPRMFDWQVRTTLDGERKVDLEVTDTRSKFFGYLINTSRIHWRKELEELWQDRGADEMETYRNAHRFDIAGPLLNADEVAEQKQNLANKLFAIGYNLHRYKSPSRAWAIFAMDNKVGDENECNGRSGKSFFFNAFRYFTDMVTLSGRNPKLLDNPHVFDRVDKHTGLLYIDDCSKYLPVEQFYDVITGGMTVNPKNNRSFYIDFDHSPKICFSTNYAPREFNQSTAARMLYLVFSDYYHEKTEENDYLESRRIFDDFGQNLMTSPDYTEEDWNADFNFLAQCLTFYLDMTAINLKIQPPMGNILLRKYRSDMGDAFEDWAFGYFAQQGENVNCFIPRKKAYDEFLDFSKLSKSFWTMNRFTKALKGFAMYCPYISEYNPADLADSTGRLQRKIDGKTEDVIYMRTLLPDGTAAPPAEPGEVKLPF